LNALPAMLSTFALLCVLIFIFACGGVELITKSSGMQAAAVNDPTLRSILELHFSTLPMVSLTLIRFVTMDSIGGIYEPLIREQPLLILYFVLLIGVITITVMDLITAQLVEHSITRAKADRDLKAQLRRQQIKDMIPQIEDLFTELDYNRDGLVTQREIRSTRVHMPEAFAHFLTLESLLELFEAMDNDNSGAVDKDEFVEGLIDFAMSEVPIETIKILHCCRVQKKQSRNMLKQLQLLDEGTRLLGAKVEAVHRDVKALDLNRQYEDNVPMEGHLGKVPSFRATVPSTPKEKRKKPKTPR